MEIKFFATLAVCFSLWLWFLSALPSIAVKVLKIWLKKPEPNFITPTKIVPGSIRCSWEETSEAARATQQTFQQMCEALSRLSAIQSGDLYLSIGRLRAIFRPSRKEIRRRKIGFTASMQRDTPRVPARWIPSTRKRKKLRRKLTPQYL